MVSSIVSLMPDSRADSVRLRACAATAAGVRRAASDRYGVAARARWPLRALEPAATPDGGNELTARSHVRIYVSYQ